MKRNVGTIRTTVLWSKPSARSPMTEGVAMLLVALVLLFGSPGLAESLPGPASPAQVPDKLLDSRSIIEPLERGQETVRVIVSLAEPEALERTANLDIATSLDKRQYEVAAVQAAVLSTLDPADCGVIHIFENQAAFAGEVTAEGLAKLLNDPRIKSVSPDYLMQRDTAQGIALMNAMLTRQTYNGQGVAIAVVDDGFDYGHPKLGGGGFPNSKVIGGEDIGENYDGDPAPGNGNLNPHGTPCAGIAAGNIGDTGDYIGGVASEAKLYALKVSNAKGDVYSSATIKALEWCVSNKNKNPQYPILVVSISHGYGRYYDSASADKAAPEYARAVNDAVAAGITVLASSGNEGYCDSVQIPAALTNVISVGSVYDADISGSRRVCVPIDFCGAKYPEPSCPSGYYTMEDPQADLVPYYSNTASLLDILAPADLAHTLDVVGPEGYSADDYCSDFGGTSAACPYAAGAVACLQSASQAIRGSYLTPSQVRDILTSTGDDVTDPKADLAKPRINLGRAVGSLGNASTAKDTFVLTFEGIAGEEIAFVPDGYGQLAWSDSFCLYSPPPKDDNGYAKGMISPDYVAYNGSGNPVDVSGDPFDLVGAHMTAAWQDSLSIAITGYRSNKRVYSQTVTVNRHSPTWIALGYEAVERVEFTPVPLTGLGYQFVMDDMVIERPRRPDNVTEYASTDVPKDIMDDMDTFSRLVISETGTIADINVKLDITHSYDQDICVYLRPPSGLGLGRILLLSGVGGAGDNFRGTILDDEASRPLSLGSAPFVGSYKPAQTLSTLYGRNMSGTWTLQVYDDVGRNVGRLNSWSLIIQK